MIKMYDRQKSKYENFRDQCFSEEQVKALKDDA